MAKKKKSFFGTLLKLGGLAAATAAVYYKRDEIKAFIADKAERLFPEATEIEPLEETMAEEPEVVIDAKAAAEAPDAPETTEETEESAPAD